MKNYFPHDHHARSDKKLINLIRVMGLAGLGLYWCVIEMLYEESGWLNISDLDSITYDLRTDTKTINSLIADFDLFFVEGEKFSSKAVLFRLKLIESKSSQASKAARLRWQKCKEDANAMQTHSDRNALKEIKEKEIKTNESKEEDNATLSIPPENKTPELFPPETLPLKAEKPKEKSSAKKEKVAKHLFRNSPFFDKQKFIEAFDPAQYGEIDLSFYYGAVLDWSESNGVQKIDWIAQARSFMRNDNRDNKLKRKNNNGSATNSFGQKQSTGNKPSAAELAYAIAS